MTTNITTNVYLCARTLYVALLIFGLFNVIGVIDQTRSYNFTFNERRRCHNCRKKCAMSHTFFSHFGTVLLLIFFVSNQMSSCARGLGNNDCFLWNGTRITSKPGATLYYKNSSYITGKSLYAIRKDSLNSAKVLCKTKKSEADTQLCIAKQKK